MPLRQSALARRAAFTSRAFASVTARFIAASALGDVDFVAHSFARRRRPRSPRPRSSVGRRASHVGRSSRARVVVVTHRLVLVLSVPRRGLGAAVARAGHDVAASPSGVGRRRRAAHARARGDGDGRGDATAPTRSARATASRRARDATARTMPRDEDDDDEDDATRARRRAARAHAHGDAKTFEAYAEAARLGEASTFVADARASRGFGVGGAARTLCDAHGAARAVTRVAIPDARSAERVRDEMARAKIMERARARVRWGWAKESALRGALATKAERWEEAERCFAQALELDPEHVRAYAARGACYANRRMYAEAIRDFDRALKIDPNDGAAKAYKAAVEEKARRLERARSGANVGARATTEDLDSLRARVLNPARGLDALSRSHGATKTYEMELGDDDDGVDARSRRERKRKKERKKERKKRKKREKKRSRRDDSSSSSSSS